MKDLEPVRFAHRALRAFGAACIIAGLLGCADNKEIDGTEYESYGLINKDELKDPGVRYSLAWGNIIWGCLLVETIIAPVYFFGFSLWEPEEKIQRAPQAAPAAPEAGTAGGTP